MASINDVFTLCQSILAKANAKTGKNDTTVDAAVNSLVALEQGVPVPTCTVNVTFSYDPKNTVMVAAVLKDGEITIETVSRSTASAFTIKDVVCGSVISLHTRNSFYIYDWKGTFSIYSTSAALSVPYTSGTYTVDIGMLDD